jgi:hypothetical protein
MIKKKLIKKSFNELLTDLNRNQLGSISLNDINNIQNFSASERKSYLQDAEVIWSNPVFQNEVKKIVQTQLEFIAKFTTEQSQVYVGRGTINGIMILYEWIEKLHNEYTQLTKPEEKFDPFDLEG